MKVSKLAVALLTVVTAVGALSSSNTHHHQLFARASLGGSNDNMEESQCDSVTQIPATQQCAFVKDHCKGDEYQIGRINYLSLYYCSGRSSVSMGFLVVLLVTCFASLGVTASDYLCPNLYTISKFLKLSDNLAGLTLLALGNSSPDVLSIYKAMSVGSSDLALSESLGAAFFITTVVLGLMAIVHPFKVSKKLFFRDAGFFLAVSVLIFFVLIDSYLSIVNSIILIAAYVLYVVVALSTHSISRAKYKKQLQDQRTRANFLLNTEDNEENQENDIFLDTFSNLPGIETLNFNEEQEDSGDADKDVESDIPGSFGLKVLLKELTKHSHLHKRIVLNLERPFTAPVTYSGTVVETERRDIQTSPSDSTTPITPDTSIGSIDDSEGLIESSLPSTELVASSTSTGIFSALRNDEDYLTRLVAPQMLDLSEQNAYSKLTTILLLPISVMLRISNPVRDQATLKAVSERELLTNQSAFQSAITPETDSEDDDEFSFEIDRSVLLLQAIFGTLFLYVASPFTGFIMLSISTVSGYALFYLVQKNYLSSTLADCSNNVPATSALSAIKKFKIINYVAAFVGFFISLSWVSFFATEIISILKSMAVIYDLSDDILGVTVFAIGNSVGDLISNFTIARMGMPIMAFGACFGGPLLALCSIGLSGLILGEKNNSSHGLTIENTSTIKSTTIALIVNIALIMVLVPINNWKFDRRIGIILILMWIISTTFSLLNELI